MSDSQTTKDLDAQIEKLEAKLNELLDSVQKTQATAETQPPSQETLPSTEPTQQTQEYIPPTPPSPKTRQEILAEYEEGYLRRLEENEKAQEEIRRAAADLQAKKNASQPISTRGSLPKGF